MSVLAWIYVGGAALTMAVTLLLSGWRDYRDLVVALFMGRAGRAALSLVGGPHE